MCYYIILIGDLLSLLIRLICSETKIIEDANA